MMTMRSDRPGFVLPLAVLLIGFMTAGVVAAFARTTSEVRVVDNERMQTQAFALAQAGLERYLSRGKVTPLDTTMTLTGGSARVRVTLMKKALTVSDTAIYLVRSDGLTKFGANGIPAGQRTVAMFAYRLRGRMQVMSAWTSLSGLVKHGVSGGISGVDHCNPADTIPGVMVPTGTFRMTGGSLDQVIDGDPRLVEAGTQANLASQVKVDWPNIANPTAPALAVDYVVCMPGTTGYDNRWGPCTSWPSVSNWPDKDFWPTIVINGTLTSIPNNFGRGTLIVTGDLNLGMGDKFEGIILVGNRIDDSGSGEIRGAVLTGLNVLFGQTVGESSKADGTKDYLYDSCAVENAASNHMRLAQMPSSWADNWATW
jgi:hypothetical protein